MKLLLLTVSALSFAVCAATQAAGPAPLKEGSRIPAVMLQDQDGKDFRLDQQKDRAVVLTFIFSRCTVAAFCPTMSANFRTLQEAIRKDPGLAGKVQLVSISIDPSFDKPEILKRYAEHFALDTSDWSFVTGDERTIHALANAFSVFIDPTADGTIDHTLSTAVAAPDGTIRKIWKDNQWTVDSVLKTLHSIL